LADTRAFVEKLRSYDGVGALPPVVLAALRRRMVALAAEIADGVLFANASLSHLPQSPAAVPAAREGLTKGLAAAKRKAAPQLCEAAQRVLDRQFAQIYRPKADDPRPYRELLSRLGDGVQFSALRWLAEHRCAVEAELSDAESLVRAYQDSPERGACSRRWRNFAGSHNGITATRELKRLGPGLRTVSTGL